MTRKALKAKIEEGLFPGEVLVRIRDAEDRDISFFAPKAAVHPAAGEEKWLPCGSSPRLVPIA